MVSNEPISKRSLPPSLCVMWYIPHGGAQILILKIFTIFTRALTSWRLRLKFSPSLTLDKIERFEIGSTEYQF